MILSLISIIFLQVASPIFSQEQAIPHDLITNLNQLELDQYDRLQSHWLVYSNTPSCRSTVEGTWNQPRNNFKLRKLAPMDGDAAFQIFGEVPNNERCLSACLERGTLNEHLPHVLPTKIYNSTQGLHNFFLKQCQAAEIGFIIHGFEANVFYISDSGQSTQIHTMAGGEQNTFWQVSYLGHKFALYNKMTNVMEATVTVEYNGIYVIGQYNIGKQRKNLEDAVRATLGAEWDRSRRVTRTFTDIGFSIGQLPLDLYASMSAYYHNNRHSLTLEEWDTKGVYVNWWESPVYMIGMPWELKRYWQSRLKTLVEEWSGVELELTDIYGMRQYTDGARLLTHVDREETHAASLIVNIAQSNIRKPWAVEIYDFANRLHEVEMNPGDIVYYESARCLHGRMKPLEGQFYVNLFAHYRPKGGDSKWYTRTNPPETPEQLIDIGECTPAADGPMECTKGRKLPFLNREWEQLHGPHDLFWYWKKVSPNETTATPHSINSRNGGLSESQNMNSKGTDVTSEL